MDGQHIKHTHSQASEKEEQEKEKCISINPIFLFSIHWRERKREARNRKKCSTQNTLKWLFRFDSVVVILEMDEERKKRERDDGEMINGTDEEAHVAQRE